MNVPVFSGIYVTGTYRLKFLTMSLQSEHGIELELSRAFDLDSCHFLWIFQLWPFLTRLRSALLFSPRFVQNLMMLQANF